MSGLATHAVMTSTPAPSGAWIRRPVPATSVGWIRRLPRLQRVALLFIGGAIYLECGLFGLSHAFVNPSASAVWFPSGVALAMAMLAGWEAWLVIALSAFAVNMLTTGGVASCLVIALGNSAEAAVGAALIARFAAGTSVLARPQTLLMFIVLAFASCMVSATIGTATLAIGHQGPLPNVFAVWSTWWLGDAVGAIIACPPLLLWMSRPWRHPGWWWWLELACMLVSVVAIGQLVFGGVLADHVLGQGLAFLCLPPILWAGMRLGQRATALATLALLGLAWYQHLLHPNRLVGLDPNASILLLQGFMAVTAITGLVVAASVAERERLEATLQERAQALRRSNADLERFASVASHDLKEPLRAVRNYLELIERRAGASLEAKAREFLAMAVGGAERMQGLIDAILDFSKAVRSRRGEPEVDINRVLADTLHVLESRIAERGATVATAPLPHLPGDPAHLGLVFQNLLSNALKFCRDRAPVVEVWADEEPAHWVFHVRDNGIGIPAEGRDRVFEMFQRLHAQSEFPGAGIGLATCRRIVEDHGGGIWLESAVAEGTTVSFRLPKRASSQLLDAL